MAGSKTALFVRRQIGGMLSIVDETATTGDIFFVDSGNSKAVDKAGAGNNPDRPFATIDFAIGQCTANQGDRIYAMPGHAETLTAANTMTFDKAGVSLYGLGDGSDRPTISLATNVAATITVSAANVRFENLLISNIIDNCTSMLTITGDDFTAVNIETRDTGSVEAALVWTIIGDRWHINGYVHAGEGSGDQAVAVLQVTGTDRGILENFDLDSAGSTALFSALSTANTLIRVHDGYFIQREAAVGVIMSLPAADTGFIGPNIHMRLVDDNTDPYAVIDSASNVNFIGPITVCAGDDEAALDITAGLAVEADQNLVQTPWGMARVVTKAYSLATSLVPIFTPSVGKSMIVGLYGEVTTEIGTAADLRLQYDTTATDPINLTALTVMDATKVENWFGITGDPADDMLSGVARCKMPIIVDGGHSGVTIGIVGTEANSNTGAMTWYCVYIPLERGAIITAA